MIVEPDAPERDDAGRFGLRCCFRRSLRGDANDKQRRR